MRSQLDRDVWDRIATVFDRALETTGAERMALLDRLCGSDLTIRREVEEMLQAHEQQAGLMAERRLVVDDHAHANFDAVLAEGARVGPYRIVSLVGAGGMGDVYRAERADGAYRQTVALKVLRPGYRTAEMVRRFRVEREALARLAHPNIATILDGGTMSDGRPFIVLQFVDGVPITTYCEERALSLRDRLALFLEVAATVQFAHGRLVVHRDIKPSNILVQSDGRPRLLDFGIAKLLDPRDHPSLAVDTTPDVRVLTLAHAAPEQVRGEPPTTAADVYALGVLLFELITGVKPFSPGGRGSWELERAILDTPAPAPSAVAPSRAASQKLRGDLDHIALMALRKEPERRYVSAAALADDVQRYLDGHPVRARSYSLRYRARKFIARNRALVASAAAVAALLLAFATTAALQARRIARERDRAERERLAADDAMSILTRLFERADPNKYPGGDTLRVTALLDDAEREVARLGNDPAREAALWRTVGRMRSARGEYSRAIELLTRARDRRQHGFGALDAEAARIHHDIAQVRLSYAGEEAARPALDSAYAELRRSVGDDDPDTRAALSDLMLATGDSLVRRSLLARLVELERRAPSRDPVAIGNTLEARGSELYYAGRFVEAATMFQASADAYERRLPPEHEYVRAAYRDLAMSLAGAGQLERADSLQRAEIAIAERMRASALTRAMSHEALALTLMRLRHPDSAETEERVAFRLFAAGAAPEHWRTWSAARNLAFIAAARGRAEDGLALLDSAIAIARANPDSGTSIGYLLTQRVPFLLPLGRIEEARRSLEDGERGMGDSPSVSSAHRADVNRYAGMVALASGDVALAAARFRAAVTLAEAPGRPNVVPNIHTCLLGVALAEQGDVTEARPLLGAPCTTYESAGVPHPLISDWIARARKRAAVQAR